MIFYCTKYLKENICWAKCITICEEMLMLHVHSSYLLENSRMSFHVWLSPYPSISSILL